MTALDALPREARQALVAFQELVATLDAAIEETRAAGDLTKEQIAQAVFERLSGVFIARGARRQAPGAAAEEDRLGYVFAGYCDEALLHHIDWDGASDWSRRLLEREFFGTHIAGERVFDMVDEMASLQGGARRDLAAALMIALSCGFRGKHRGRDAEDLIEERKERLFELASDRSAPEVASLRAHLAAAYAHTAEAAGSWSRRGWRWWPAIFVVCGWLILSTSLWAWKNADVRGLSQDIIATSEDVHEAEEEMRRDAAAAR